MIYLDAAATTRMADEVVEAMLPWMRQCFGNPGSPYGLGREAKNAVEKARCQVAGLFNSEPENIIFTSGGSEGNSFCFQAASKRLEANKKKHILVSAVEHDSVIRAAESLIKQGFDVEYIPVCTGGSVRLETIKSLVREDTGLISVMYVNNETGAVNILEEIGGFCHERGILFHTDCVQAAGFLPIDVERLQCNYAVASAHKFHGPKGVGCVFIKDKEDASPMIYGGHGQEYGLRGGTENTAGIVGMGVAADIANENLVNAQEITWSHRVLFWEIISKELGDSVHLNGQWLAPSRVLNIRVDGIDSDTFVMAMDVSGVCISAGSACRSLELEPSRVLTAMGLTANEARSSVRVSFSNMNSSEEVEMAARLFVENVKMLRGGCYDL